MLNCLASFIRTNQSQKSPVVTLEALSLINCAWLFAFMCQFLMSKFLHVCSPQKKYGPDCHLIERIEENKYNTYASAEWKNKKKFMFVAINAKGKPINATKTRKTKKVTHFLPTLVEPWLWTQWKPFTVQVDKVKPTRDRSDAALYDALRRKENEIYRHSVTIRQGHFSF